MAEKIRILTDSASDISVKQAEQFGIEVIGFHILVGDKEYREHVDFTTQEFYKMMDEIDDMPHTSQILISDYTDSYTRAYNDGITDLINVTIASIGSNSYNNAITARDMFYDEHPEAKDKFRITVMDSKGYTAAYGFPIIEAAKKIQKGGAKASDIIAYLQDWFDSIVIICTAFTLKYAKKSGRVGAVSAFVGEALGLKPVITFTDAVSETVAKVRGEKAVIPKVIDIALEKMVPQTPYAVLLGSREDCTKEIIDLMKKKVGYPPTEILEVGATINCHLGHAVAGLVVKSNNRG